MFMEIRNSTQNEHSTIINQMKEIKGYDTELVFEPKVGIFWFNYMKNKLFDVQTLGYWSWLV